MTLFVICLHFAHCMISSKIWFVVTCLNHLDFWILRIALSFFSAFSVKILFCISNSSWTTLRSLNFNIILFTFMHENDDTKIKICCATYETIGRYSIASRIWCCKRYQRYIIRWTWYYQYVSLRVYVYASSQSYRRKHCRRRL